jgi:hypothetical protein
MDGKAFRYIFSCKQTVQSVLRLYFQQKVEFGAMLPFLQNHCLNVFSEYNTTTPVLLEPLGSIGIKDRDFGPKP